MPGVVTKFSNNDFRYSWSSVDVAWRWSLTACITAEGVFDPLFGMINARISLSELSVSALSRRSPLSRYGWTCAGSCGLGASSAMMSVAWSAAAAAAPEMSHDAMLSSSRGVLRDMVGVAWCGWFCLGLCVSRWL